MRIDTGSWHVWTGVVTVAMLGCQSADDAPPAPVAVDAVATAPGPEDSDSRAVDEVELNPDGADAPLVGAAEQQFVPPFPERVDLFVPPRRARAVQQGDDVVELRGFITPPDNKGTWALLLINGIESPVAAGQEKMGVMVVSIDEPNVVLQRGRNRWTETLE